MSNVQKYIGNPNSFDNFVFHREFEIRAALKAISPYQTFALSGLRKSNACAIQNLECDHIAEQYFGSSMPAYAADQKSAACAFAQAATQITLFNSLAPSLQQAFDTGTPLLLVTIADINDRRLLGDLSTFKSSTLRRRLEKSFSKLHFDCRKVSFAVASIEVSASIFLGLNVFEPHAHVIIAGCEMDQVRQVFQRQLTRNQGTNLRPLQIKDITETPGQVLSYISKLRPEMRSGCMHESGKKRSKDNAMRGEVLLEWLEWMAFRPLSDLVVPAGISPPLQRRLVEGNMRAEIVELIERHQRMVRRGQELPS